MCKDKNGEVELLMDGLSFSESFDAVVNEARFAMYGAENPMAIDWTKFKQLLGKFIEVFGPILIPLILGGITTKPPIVAGK